MKSRGSHEPSWFHHSLDLPFQIITEDEGLQDRSFSKPLQFEDDDSDVWGLDDKPAVVGEQK